MSNPTGRTSWRQHPFYVLTGSRIVRIPYEAVSPNPLLAAIDFRSIELALFAYFKEHQ